MTDLLKEAIADAKAVRETALANAKLALEEAFTPRLQSMLSAKLAEEEDMDNDMPMEGDYGDDSEMNMPMEGDYGDEEPMDATLEAIIRELEGEEMEEELDASDIGAGDNELDTEASYTEDPGEGELYEEEDEDIDINEIIAALREEEELKEGEVYLFDEMGEPLTKLGDSIDALLKDANLIQDPEWVTALKRIQTQFNNLEGVITQADSKLGVIPMKESLEDEEETMGEAQYTAGVDDEGPALEEAYRVIRFLKSKINEVNLLNAKLLFSNKLFKNHSLNESQKMKVIENFDRATTLREVKLVYTTLAESFNVGKSKRQIKESRASKPAGRSTAPAKAILSEGNDMVARWKKLANLK